MAVPGIRRAREMGLHVVASDADKEAPGFELADDRVLASVYDVEATVRAARSLHAQRRISGVLCIGVDATLTVAAVAEALDLESVSMDVARRTTDKLAMKERLRADGVTIPWFAPIQSVSELRKQMDLRRLPLVLKPIDSRGSRGVLRLTPDVDLDWAMAHAMSFSERSMLIVEEFIPGPQISSETVLFDGKAFTVGLADRNYEKLEAFAPYILEDGGVLPADLSPEERKGCCRVVEEAARSLGVTRGVVKGDLVLGPGDRCELGRRLSTRSQRLPEKLNSSKNWMQGQPSRFMGQQGRTGAKGSGTTNDLGENQLILAVVGRRKAHT